MNIQLAIAALQKFDPAGFQKLDQQITQHILEAGASLTIEQALFAKNNIHTLPAFFKTPEGRIAVQTFVQDWIASQKSAST